MASLSNNYDGYHDDSSSRSPRSYRSQQSQLNRQNSRQMDSGYGTMQSGMFGTGSNNAFAANNGQSMRFQNGPFSQPISNNLSNGHFPYDSNAAQTWNGSNGLSAFPGSLDPARSIRPTRGRAGLQNLWDEPFHQQQPMQHMGRAPSMTARADSLDDDELIPTAIVIKNIPFAIKKEQLVELMVNMNLPLPYAFNYHFDNGVFRGLAFANFTNPDETEQVINALNHMELSGRKLRVEYKKMLPLQERERIEREKRERRGQLEEQHRADSRNPLHSQLSMGTLSQPRNTPSPLSHRPQTRPANFALDIDMNDPVTLDYYTKLTVFKNGHHPETMIFPNDTPPEHRRLIHTLAHHMGLTHTSHGVGEQRQVHVARVAPGTNVSPPLNQAPRQGLTRTTTADYDGYSGYGTLRGQASVGLLDVENNAAFGRQDNSNLRNAKSFADLRSWSPSPALTNASFPAGLAVNARAQQQQQQQAASLINDTNGSNTPTLTPTPSINALGSSRVDEPFLISGFQSMGLGSGANNATSPRRQRSHFFNPPNTWGDDQAIYQSTAPIGSKRTVSIGAENVAPSRQSRGPNSNGFTGFRRQHTGKNSDELRHANNTINE